MTESIESPAPRVFVSYAHESKQHKAWVLSLAAELRTNGIDAILDQWELTLGSDTTLFMDEIRKSDRVLLICTPIYARKSNGGEGGVGYERGVITTELARSIDTAKFVCVLRDGDESGAIPVFAQTRIYIDFREDADYEAQLEMLLRDLHKVPAEGKPPLGVNPFGKAKALAIKGELPVSLELDGGVQTETDRVIRQASVLLERQDRLGWNRLVRATQTKAQATLLEWRQRVGPGDLTGDESLLRTLRAAVTVWEPMIALTLVGVEAGTLGSETQVSLLDDIINIPRWEQSGLKIVIHVPEAVGYVYHHLLGGFLMEQRRRDDAIALLLAEIRSSETGEYRKLVQNPYLMTWLTACRQHMVLSWELVLDSYRESPWLSTLFATEDRFDRSLRVYRTLASMLELALTLGTGTSPTELTKDWRLDVAPTFLIPRNDQHTTIDDLIRRAVPDRAALEQIAQAGSTSSALMREAFPNWMKQWAKRLDGPNYYFVAQGIFDRLDRPGLLP